jgi:hypothetical protein
MIAAFNRDQVPSLCQALNIWNKQAGIPRKQPMERVWDIRLIFAIKDAVSAALMIIKADCLHKAGVISKGERQWVHSRARTFLDDAALTA